MHVTVRYTWC